MGGAQMTKLSIPDMNCGHCRASVEGALGALPDAGEISVDLTNRTATVTGPAANDTLIRALDEIGFPARIVGT